MSGKGKRGRLAVSRITVQSLNVVTGLVARLALTGPILTFQDIADALTRRSGTKITRATVWRFVHGIEPHDNQLRAALGLPARVEVAVCPRCGNPPLAKHHRCPRAVPGWVSAAAEWLAERERTGPRVDIPDSLMQSVPDNGPDGPAL